MRSKVQVYVNQAMNNQSLRTSNDIYLDVLNAPNASTAWSLAQEFKKIFPADSRISESLNLAGVRILNTGKNRHLSKNYSQALIYYNYLLKEKLLTTTLHSKVEVYANQALSTQPLRTSNDMYLEVINAPSASKAWSLAQELKNLFPSYTKISEVLNLAGVRILNTGKSQHRSKNYSQALIYYNYLLNEDLLSSWMFSKIQVYANQAVSNQKLRTSNDMYLEVLSAPSASSSWSLTKELKNTFPNALEVEKSFLVAEERIFVQGINNHSMGNFKQALNYYQMLLDEENVNFSIKTRVNAYKYLAENNYALSNLVVKNTYYNISIEDLANKNLKIKDFPPQISKINGGFRDATKAEVMKYINPALVKSSSELLQFLVLSGSSGISKDDLNTELINSRILKGHGKSFQRASQLANVNELYLITHSLLETGYGTSRLANGIKINGRTVYNMYGIGATDDNPDLNGARRAYTEGWFTVEDAIIGGAQWIGKNYINNANFKQDTLYKMRWNPSNPGVHQYATDVGWAYKQTHRLSHIIDLSLKYDLILLYDIPFFK